MSYLNNSCIPFHSLGFIYPCAVVGKSHLFIVAAAEAGGELSLNYRNRYLNLHGFTRSKQTVGSAITCL